MNRLFMFVANGLVAISRWLRMTYNEINIIVYYLIIPLSWAIMADCIIGLPVLTGIVVCIWIGIFIATRNTFRAWCDRAFEDSVKFLLSFRCLGWNYVTASVVICVIVPLLVYAILIYFLI